MSMEVPAHAALCVSGTHTCSNPAARTSRADGAIDFDEFTHFLTDVLGLIIPKRELKRLWTMLDVNGSNEIDFLEFADAVFPNHRFRSEATGADDVARRSVSKQIQRGAVSSGLNDLLHASENKQPSGGKSHRGSDDTRSSADGTRQSRASKLPPAAEILTRMERLEEQMQHLIEMIGADRMQSAIATGGQGRDHGAAAADAVTAASGCELAALAMPTALQEQVRAEVERAVHGTNARLDQMASQLVKPQCTKSDEHAPAPADGLFSA